MLEEIHEKLKKTYTNRQKELLKDSSDNLSQQDKSFLKLKIEQFEKSVEHYLRKLKHEYLTNLANTNNKASCYQGQLDSIEARFIDGNYIKELLVTTTDQKTNIKTEKTETHYADIEIEFIRIALNGEKNILIGHHRNEDIIDLLLAHAFSDLRFYEYLKENPPSDYKNISITKMQWNGTQKQLAELFVELKRKGWIDEIEANTVQQSFTGTKSIKQYLKPTKSKLNNYQETYESLFGPEYQYKFSSITENVNN